MLPTHQPVKLAKGAQYKEHTMSQTLNSATAVIGIDIGKNSFRLKSTYSTSARPRNTPKHTQFVRGAVQLLLNPLRVLVIVNRPSAATEAVIA